MKVLTQFIYPPIPQRSHDWMAYFPDMVDGAPDGSGNGPTGYGETEAEALKDLIPEAMEYFQTIAYGDGRSDEREEQAEFRKQALGALELLAEFVEEATGRTPKVQKLYDWIEEAK